MSTRRQAVSQKIEIFYLVCIVLFVVSGFFTIWGPGGYLEMRRTKLDLQAQRARVINLKRLNSERLQSIEALKTNKEAMEEYARKQGYARKDEIIQQLPAEPADPQTTPPRSTPPPPKR